MEQETDPLVLVLLDGDGCIVRFFGGEEQELTPFTSAV